VWVVVLAATSATLGQPQITHSTRFIGNLPGTLDPNAAQQVSWGPTVTIDTVDVEINQRTNDTRWAGAVVNTSIQTLDSAIFYPLGPTPEPPQAPGIVFVEGNFFATNRTYPNDPYGSGTPYAFSFASYGLTSIAGDWAPLDPLGDPTSPDITIFRLSLARPVDSPPLTLAPGGKPIALIEGASTVLFVNPPGQQLVPFSFTIYETPEPAAFALLAMGAAAFVRRR
jgi:hypothetical protein